MLFQKLDYFARFEGGGRKLEYAFFLLRILLDNISSMVEFLLIPPQVSLRKLAIFQVRISD